MAVVGASRDEVMARLAEVAEQGADAPITASGGEVVFLVGGNGSGKSTFVKVLTGLLKLEYGELAR